MNYKDGRKILELAAESGLSCISAGLESISGKGQKQSGAWRKLHCTSQDAFDIRRMKEDIRVIQSLGIEIMGFFIVGWDDDTPDTYQRTLDFCDECSIIPFIFTLRPMPGSQIYRDYLEQGRMLTDLAWDEYGGPATVFKHPAMSRREMLELNAGVMSRGYSWDRIARRTLHSLRYRFSLDAARISLFAQLGLKKAYGQLFEHALSRAARG